MRYAYLVTMAVAFIIAFISIVQYSFPGGDIVAIHLDSVPITFHHLLDFLSFLALAVVWIVSRRNYLQAASTRHVTTIEKK